MRGMKLHPLPLLLLLPFLLPGCGDDSSAESPAASTLSPQEMYEKGRALLKPHIEQNASDFARALEWTRKAAEAGWQKAQTDLGGIYLYGGKGTLPNGKEALKWFTRAAEQGSKEAEFFIGEIYNKGMAGEKDKQAALKHWRIAAEAGVSEAQQRLGTLLAGQRQTVEEGLIWLRRAATEGHAQGKAEAALNLGHIYAAGIEGVKTNLEEAAHWYAIAAEEGDARAQHVYAVMLLEGEPLAQDVKEGMFMLRRAASQEYLPAMAEFIRRLRNAATATPEERKEAEAWDKRLQELLQKRRAEQQSAAQPAPQASPRAAE